MAKTNAKTPRFHHNVNKPLYFKLKVLNAHQITSSFSPFGIGDVHKLGPYIGKKLSYHD